MKRRFKCVLTVAFALFATATMASVSLEYSDAVGWSLDASTTYNDEATLRTGSIADGETTSVTLTFSDTAAVEFYVRTSTEANCDRLFIEIDGCSYDYSGEQEMWQQFYWDWGWEGDHVVTLTYSKDWSTSSGEDCCWIWFDGVTTLDLQNSINEDGWAMDVAHPWIAADGFWQTNYLIEKDVPYMKPPSLSDGEESWMSYTVDGSETFDFYYTVDSEEGSDCLVVSVDGVEVESFSGSLWYLSYQIQLPDTNRHVVKWTYRKDSNGNSCGNDSAYIWFEGIEKILTSGYSMNLAYPWTMDEQDGKFCLRSGSIPEGDVTSISRTMTSDGITYFDWKVSSEHGHDFFKVFQNGELIASISGEEDWLSDCIYVSKGDVITWAYEKDDNGKSEGEDCGWLEFHDIDALSFLNIMNLIPDDDTTIVESSITIKFDLNTGRDVIQEILGGDAGVSFASSDISPWVVDESGNGMHSAARIGQSWMSAVVVGRGTFSFDWLSSNGTLACYVDGELTASISGTTGWEHEDLELSVNGIAWNAPDGYDDPDELIVPDTVSVMSTLDLIPSPRQLDGTNATLRIIYDPSWENAHTATVSVNGEALGSYESSGNIGYAFTAYGEYRLTLTFKNAYGELIGEPLTASFVIRCDPIPELSGLATTTDVMNALTGSADRDRLIANVTNVMQYAAYRAWALSITNGTVTAQMVKDSAQAWLSYALGADALIGKEITSNDVHIVFFDVEGGGAIRSLCPIGFTLEVAIDGVNIGGGLVAEEMLNENLKKVLCVEGATELNESAFSSEGLSFTFQRTTDGKAKATVTPVSSPPSFFLRVKVK